MRSVYRLPALSEHWPATVLVLGIVALAAPAHAQIGTLLSPGPLARAHASLEGASNCEKCHEPGRKVAADRCLRCHRPIAERIAARKGVHRDAQGDCVTCHVEHAGRDAELRPFDTRSFDHASQTGFALDGLHARLSRTCSSCHKTRSFLTASPACASCHSDPHKGALGPQCTRCHSTAVPFKQVSRAFDHSRTRFPLVGAHRTVACARCHIAGAYTGLKFEHCLDCHKSPHRAALGDACTTCHTQETWRTQRIDHAKTSFPLRGRHVAVACAKCHVRPAARVRLKAERCADCHSDPHRGQFKQDCGACHQETGFRRAAFDHNATGFPLTGRHIGLTCQACHKGAGGTTPAARPAASRATLQVVDFRGLSRACSSCHPDVHKGEVGTTCESCHSTASFKVARFNHPRFPEFFGGQHATIACAGCHDRAQAGRTPQPGVKPGAGMRFKNISTACVTCHRDVHLGQVGTTCETCHSVEGVKFAPVKFSHDRSRFPLAGLHRNVQCRACHKAESATFPGGSGTAVRLKGVATTCAGCHADVHLGQLGSACETCHTVDAARYAPVRFSHDRASFKLTGRHRDAACSACHKRETGTFPAGTGTAVRLKGMKTSCQSCHKDPHLGQMKSACETCHQTTTFRVTSYTHTQTPDLFKGKHATLTCGSCHKQEQAVFPAGPGLAIRYTGLGPGCASCHRDPHGGGFSTTCESCHNPAGWQAVSRGFHQATAFPLLGRHASVDCASCHINGATKGTPRTCYDCHWVRRQDDRYMTRLGAQCEQCHRPTSWTAVNWNHGAATGLQLSPVHRALGCDSCHKDQRFQGGGLSCFQCHQADYQRTTSPNHTTAGFPTDCQGCHSAAAASWRTGVINHNSFFPLAGAHAATPCASCHVGGVYRGTNRTCFGCHRADYDRTQNPNHRAAGLPTTCESCHQASATSWRGAFNHIAVFPLVGVHATQPCTACHKNNVFAGTPRLCYGCHQAAYNAARDPNHIAARFPTTCETCHNATDGSWSQGRFNHPWFPVNHGNAGGQCSACHQDPNNYKVFTCLTCHDRARMDNEHQGRAGYRYDSAACYSCHPNGRGDEPVASHLALRTPHVALPPGFHLFPSHGKGL